MELNANGIIKALECCYTPLASDCNDCGYRGQSVENGEYIGCSNRLMANALTLIKQLTEENERLREDNEIKSQKRANIFEIVNAYERGKADTVREMQKRLKDALNDMARYDFHGNNNEYFIIGKSFIDRIAKEMIGDE